MVEHSLAYSIVGSADTIEAGLRTFIEGTRPDELMLTAHIYDQPARLRSIEIIAEVHSRLERAERGAAAATETAVSARA